MLEQPDVLTRPNEVDMVDLFAGPGGLDVPARWLGLKVYGLELDADACATRRAAGFNHRVHDVRDFGPASVPGASILTGGPPCQTFTVAGSGAGRRALKTVLGFVERMGAGEYDLRSELSRLDDDRTALVLEPLRWALEAGSAGIPYRTIVLEQVPAVLPVWKSMGKVLTKQLGYRVAHKVLHTEMFGVPQTRRRAVLIASLDIDPRMPEPTHRIYRKAGLRASDDHRLPVWKTMGQALPTRGDDFEVISNYGTGGNPKLRGVRTSGQPSATVTGKISRNRVVSANGESRFSDAEAGRLQSFPEDYPWSGGAIAQQIGNAVPPIFGLHVLSAALGLQVTREQAEQAFELSWMSVRQRYELGEPAVLAGVRRAGQHAWQTRRPQAESAQEPTGLVLFR
ncbi:DNA cytosine methyltransferase [Nocardia amamiensis]|uniref:DNA cytosine methyltransferase n=1 Tax=Nocardia amamiensis TaxID=404578 RepID=UPI0033C3D70C